MASHRGSGQATQASRSAFSQTTSSLAPEFFRKLPLGLAILYREDPDDIKSYRIVDVNPAAAHIAGSTLEGLRGRTLSEVPNLLDSLVAQRPDTFHACYPEQWAQLFKGDKRIGSRVYSVKVFALSADCMGVTFEDVTEHRLAEQIISESERASLPIQPPSGANYFRKRTRSFTHPRRSGIRFFSTGSQRTRGQLECRCRTPERLPCRGDYW